MRRVIIGNGNYQDDGSVIIPLDGNPEEMFKAIKTALRMEPDKLIVDLATARKKKKYHVVMKYTEYYGIDVEAYDETEAADIAENTSECYFEGNRPWEVNEVREVEE